jgi:hypothetical protein
MGAGRRREVQEATYCLCMGSRCIFMRCPMFMLLNACRAQEEKLCPLCIEPLDPHEKTHFPCPCG